MAKRYLQHVLKDPSISMNREHGTTYKEMYHDIYQPNSCASKVYITLPDFLVRVRELRKTLYRCERGAMHRLEVMEWAIRVLTADQRRPSTVGHAQELAPYKLYILRFYNPRPPKVDHGNGFVWWPTPKDFQHV